jgi:hypothetical protein
MRITESVTEQRSVLSPHGHPLDLYGGLLERRPLWLRLAVPERQLPNILTVFADRAIK